MIHSANEWLEKYEIKKPDYDYIERDYVGMSDAIYQPARFEKVNGVWEPKDKSLMNGASGRIMFVGDITCFEKQFEEAKQGRDYDFRYSFERIRLIFNESDLVVGNLETMIVPYAPYRTEKYVAEQNFHCNAPLEFLDAVRDSGVDVVTNANNHDLDTGAVGIGETIDNVEKMGLIQTGTFKTDKKRYEIIQVNGFKVAVVAFATEHNNKRCNLTDEGVEFLLNDYSKEKAQMIINQARNDGAEVVFVCIHWGKEHKLVQNAAQEKIAQELADMGYDCIIGSHPHVLQPYDEIKSGGRTVPVFYSMGNYVSHNSSGAKSRSVVACVDLKRKFGKIEIKCTYVPIYTSKTVSEKKYVVTPINRKPLGLQNKRRLNNIKKVMGEKIDINKDIEVFEPFEFLDLSAVKPAAKKPDLSKVKEYPVSYDDGKFEYSINKDEAKVVGLSKESENLSYSVPAKILDVPVTAIAEGAFEGNSLVKKINFTKGISSASERMCKNCTSLEGFQLSSGISEVKREAFAGCTKLSSAFLGDKVRKIGEKAFAGCTELRSVKIYGKVSKIADNAFEGCDRAVFYCEAGSYAENYAKEHGFKVLNMKFEDSTFKPEK